MPAAWIVGLLAITAVLLLRQFVVGLGLWRGLAIGVFAMIAAVGGWWLLGTAAPPDAGPSDWHAVGSVSSDSCVKCHPDQHASWHRTFHRTMTREATEENIKGDFADAVYDYQGVRTRLLQRDGAFYMETADPDWAMLRVRAGDKGDLLPPRHAWFRVARTIGSHWIQEYLFQEPNGRYSRLPVLYHIVEQRWVHSNGAFLAPDTPDFWDKCRGTTWNDTCLYCHNTGPSKNPVRDIRGNVVGYRTEVAELGISCEACHGPAEDHVRLNRNPARRFALQATEAGDPSIINPERLPVPRRDEVCARCHGATVPKTEAWDPVTHKDPFIPGLDLTRFNTFFWSEAEQEALARNRPLTEAAHPTTTDGRFWGDGTPLTTALEYNAMALSACYQGGHGTLSCLSCHTMHPDDPNFMLKPGMGTNEACYQCHAEYRDRLTEHTRHAADSVGSLCYNCHMPHLTYSLLTTHRSHRIENPDVAASLDTGKPNACNLCHLDKSLGWVRDELSHWSDRHKNLPRELTADEESIAAGVLLMAQGDARTRAVVAGAFSHAGAHQAAGTDWYGPFLTRLLDPERYPAVRYLAHRGLRAAHGEMAAGPFDYLGLPAGRTAQLRTLRQRYDAAPIRRPAPYLPLTPQGLPDEVVLNRLLKSRHDPDLTINE
jgi:predicted CXXCH cytochrome family protein